MRSPMGDHSYAQEDISALLRKGVEWFCESQGEYYPDKVGVTSFRVYWTCGGKFGQARISSVIMGVTRVRERYGKGHPVTKVKGKFDEWGNLTFGLV